MNNNFISKKRALVMACVTSLMLSSGLISSAWADQAGWKYQPHSEDSQQQTNLANNQGYAFRFPIFEDDITPDQDVNKVVLTPQEQHQALVWGLSQTEEARYTLLMQNRSGVYYSKANVLATPVDVLGLNARTDAERTHFAELSALQDAIKHAKEFAYQQAYSEAMQQMAAEYGLQAVRPFDLSKFSPYKNGPMQLAPGDRLMFYVNPDDNTVQITADLLKMMQSQAGVQLNVYFVGSGVTQAQVVTWAKANNIPQKLVSSGSITLNLNFNYDQHISKTPSMYLVRNGQSRIVNLSKF